MSNYYDVDTESSRYLSQIFLQFLGETSALASNISLNSAQFLPCSKQEIWRETKFCSTLKIYSVSCNWIYFGFNPKVLPLRMVYIPSA